MDLFKKSSVTNSTALDFYCKCCSYNDNKTRRKDKKMLHKLARARVKADTAKERKLEVD